MATMIDSDARRFSPDCLSGTPRAHAVDRYIYLAMALWFVAITLTGFVPDSIQKIAMVEAGQRPPFPIMLHVHAVLMGAFMLLLVAQTWLMASGRAAHHMRLGLVSVALVPALVAVGFMLSPIMYQELLQMQQTAAADAQARIAAMIERRENIVLNQSRIGILFPLCIGIALLARRSDAGLHKRMMILGTAIALPPAFNRMHWLPTTMPESPLSGDLLILAAVAPMLIWDVARNHRVHHAYWYWLALNLAAALVVYSVWDTAWWHATARTMMGA